MIRTLWALGVSLMCLLSAGCRNGRGQTLGMADTTYVNALSDLRRVQTDTSLDEIMKDSSRRMVLRRHHVTSVQLENASRLLAASPAHASDLWRQIESAPRVPMSNAKAPVRTPGPPPGNNHPVPRP